MCVLFSYNTEIQENIDNYKGRRTQQTVDVAAYHWQFQNELTWIENFSNKWCFSGLNWVKGGKYGSYQNKTQ